MSKITKPPPQERLFLEDMLQIAEKGVVVHDAGGKIIFCNPTAERILGLSWDHILGTYSHGFEPATFREDGSPFPAEDHPAMVTLRTGKPCKKVVMGIEWNPEMPCTWINISSGIIPRAAGVPLLVFAIFADITPHIEAKRQLRDMAASLREANRTLADAEASLRNLLNAIPDLIWLKDPEGVYLFCNSALAKMFKVQNAEVIGKTDYDFSPPAQADFFRQKDSEAARDNKPIIIEEAIAFNENPVRTIVETVKVPMRDEAGQLQGVVGIARDITERRNMHEKLRRSNIELRNLAQMQRSLARTDPLTGLANRRAFEEAINLAFRRNKQRRTPASLLMIDIDHFKQVNDQFGHEAGDAALVCLAAKLRSNSRAFDLAARLGGEEFALLLPGTNEHGATTVAERLREDVGRTEVALARKRFHVTISIGIATFLDDDPEWQASVTRADEALYEAKSSGRNKVCLSRASLKRMSEDA
jgi:diguanylate cyclase (GGDEF)-like protein/PAS domain S-box-containing protein